MKVYIVTEGAYSEYHICAVYTEKSAAEKYADLLNRQTSYDGAGVEEWETDAVDTGRLWYLVFKSPLTNKVDAYSLGHWSGDQGVVEQDVLFPGRDRGTKLHTHVLASSREQAIKIGIDRFTQYEAEREGVL